MKLADYVADFLSEHVDHIFVGNGGCVITQLDSIERHDRIKNVPCQNEQGAAIAAEAYARIHGFGAALTTSGPGMANLFQGICCAWYDSIPVMYISGTPPTNHLKNGSGVRQKGFQEMDVVEMVTPITKYAVLLQESKHIRYELEKLIYMANEGCKGPVLLDLPDDLQRVDVDPLTMKRFVPPMKHDFSGVFSRGESLIELTKRIESSKRPVIVVGGGVKISGSEQRMKEWLKSTRLPFVTTWSTIDLFPEDEWPNLIGNFGIASNRYGNWAVQNADLIISFGSRLDTHQTGADPTKFAPNAYKICINIDNNEFYKNLMVVNLRIWDDVSTIIKQLNILHMSYPNIGKWKERIFGWKQKYPVCLPEYYGQKTVNPYVFMNELSKLTKDGDIVITDAGATLTWTMQAYKMRRKQKLFSAFNHSPMGYALPASIGAQFASFEDQIICITGDGGIHMNIQELETIVHNKLPIKIFLINNGEYGIIKQTQDTWMDGRYTASDPSSGVGFPNLSRIANAYNIPVVTIDRFDTLHQRIREVLELDSFVLCNVKIESGEQILPKLVFGKGIEDMAPLIPREEFKEIMNNEK